MKISGLDLAELTTPISEADPCGPDLEQIGEPDYLNFMASAESVLPPTYFEYISIPRPWPKIDFAAQYAGATLLLGKSRDLRLLAVLAKLLLLNRNLAGFAACVDNTAKLLSERWEAVHPRIEDASLDARLAPLQALNDFPLIGLALHYQPLIESKRSGTITYRKHLVATGQANAREGEDKLDAGTIERELQEADLEGLKEVRSHLLTLKSGIDGIRKITGECSGREAVDLPAVEPIVSNMVAWLDGVVVKRDPSVATQAFAEGAESPASETVAADAPAAPVRRGRVGSFEEAAAALAGIADYFSRAEPSSPALLLTRQAHALIGKSLVELVQILTPAKAEAAALQIGTEQPLSLPLQRMSTLLPAADAPGCEAPGPVSEAATALLQVGDRREAMALLEDVGLFYRAREPSSPIPLLTDRARGLAERDFLYLLQQMLPA